MEAGLPKDTQPQKEQIKVTDKRMFTPEGEIREEFRDVIKPGTATAASPSEAEKDQAEKTPAAQKAAEPKPQDAPAADRRAPGSGDRRRSMADSATLPETAFARFLEGLIIQAYVSLGMLESPYPPHARRADPPAARQMIDILSLLKEKTKGNLTREEEDFFETHLGELKLAFVKITKSI